MKTRSYLLFVALSSLIAACNPIVHGGGTGASGAQGGAGGMGGMGGCDPGPGGFGGTGGGTYDPCAGLSCGDACNLCPPNSDCISGDTFCDGSGQCSEGTPVCGPIECTDDSGCAYNGPCNLCPDGSTACPTAACVDGQCVMSDTSCAPPPPPACNTNADCLTPAQPENCALCPDGSSSCATNECVAGQCQAVFPPCPQD